MVWYAVGRRVQGRRDAKVRIGYVYGGVYNNPSDSGQSFGNVGKGAITGNRARQEVTLGKEYTKSLGAWSAVAVGLGSLSLNIHHVYNPITQILYQGNGKQRRASATNNGVINTVAGNENYSAGSGDGGLATEARLYFPDSIAFGPDGSLYITDSWNSRIRRVDVSGIINTVAGNEKNGFSGDGGLATEARLNYPKGIAFGPDGSLYIADTDNRRIRRVDVSGIINTVAGNSQYKYGGFSGDGGLATEASLSYPRGLAFGPDGGLYIADTENRRIRRVGVDGIINTVAGNGDWGFNGDGGLATEASLNYPHSIAFGPDGSLYIADSDNRIRRVDVDGIINTVVGKEYTGSRRLSENGKISVFYKIKSL
jgi:sugar lactone lactonase YvrE